MRISSIMKIKNKSKYYLNTVFIRFINDARELVSPNDITTNL